VKIALQLFLPPATPPHRPHFALTPLFATHPEKTPITPFLATLTKTQDFKSFTCHTFLKKLRLPALPNLERFASSRFVVGGSITIAHVRRAFARMREIDDLKPLPGLLRAVPDTPADRAMPERILERMSKLFCKNPSPTC